MKFQKPVLLLVLLLSATGCSSRSANPQSSLSVSAEVDAVLEYNRTAKSYGEWAASGHQPDDLFETLRRENQAEKWRDLCAKLTQTNDPGLSLFENALTSAADVAALDCRADLLTRISSYQLTAAQRLEDRFAARASAHGLRDIARYHPHPPLVLKKTTKFKLESRVVKVDATGGPIFSPIFGVDRLVKHYGATPYGGLGDNEINLTFDDGPLPIRTDNVLAILESAGVRANFYQMGKNAFYFNELSQRARENGHIVGSHSVFHPIMRNPAHESALFEILCGAFFVGQAAGEFVPFFRFPGGAWTEETIKITRDNGLAVFFWDMDSEDWKAGATAESVFNTAMSELERVKKGIMLMHDVHSHTAVALPYILEELAQRKYTTVVFEPLARPATAASMPARCEKRAKVLQDEKRSERKHWGAKD